MAVTIRSRNNATQQKHCDDTKTGPPALRLTPKPRLDWRVATTWSRSCSQRRSQELAGLRTATPTGQPD
jgi:hypothetical protein